MAEKTFSSLLARARERDSYWTARAVHEFIEDIFKLMEQKGVTAAELARRMDSSPAYVTRMLRGNTNFTIESMVRIAKALDSKLSLHVDCNEDQFHWCDIVDNNPVRRPKEKKQNYFPVAESHSQAGVRGKGEVACFKQMQNSSAQMQDSSAQIQVPRFKSGGNSTVGLRQPEIEDSVLLVRYVCCPVEAG